MYFVVQRLYTYLRLDSIYFLLLKRVEESLQTAIPWVNTIVTLYHANCHAFRLDINPQIRKSRKQAASWLLFHVFSVLYSLIRGPIELVSLSVLRSRISGYGRVLLYESIGIAVVIGAICILVRFLGNRNFRNERNPAV